MRIKENLPSALKYQALIIENAARDAGLDFFDVVFELLDSKDVNGVAAYGGFPVRYPSWRFGMDYERLEKGRHWGLSKIYELVINNDPTYAYLVRSNSMLEQKLVMAHVFGHADFFKHNLWFAPTDRKMLDTMGNHSTRIRRYIDAFGQESVEAFIDLCLSVDSMVDPYLPLREHAHPPEGRSVHTPASERALRTLDALSMSPVHHRDELEPAETMVLERRARSLPTYDLLGYVEENGRLEAWQRDVLHIIRAEAYYFVPQRMTKIMNEGWASFWHSRLLTGGLLEPSEILDFADCHSGATASPKGQINPYKLGIELFRHAEARDEDIFQLRRVHNDVSLVHKLVDEEFALRHVLPIFTQAKAEELAGEIDWRDLKGWVLQQLAWGGQPQIELVEVDQDQELLLVHHHDGRDLKLDAARETLLNLSRLWGRPVHLLTILDKQGRRVVASDGEVTVLDTQEAESVCSTEPRSGDERDDDAPHREAS